MVDYPYVAPLPKKGYGKIAHMSRTCISTHREEQESQMFCNTEETKASGIFGGGFNDAYLQ